MTIEVRNADSTNAHSGTVFIKLYATGQVQIAEGSVGTGTISPGVRMQIPVLTLTWSGTYSINDFANGKITLTQQT